jgi:hypothetical protein
VSEDVSFEPDQDLNENLHRMPEIQTSARTIAAEIAAAAREIAPVVDGNYRDGILIQETRSGWRVLASDQKSSWVEFGIPSRGQPAHFTLRRAVEAAGYKFKKRGA